MTAPTPEAVLAQVLKCIGDVLLEETAIGPDTRLLELPGMDSIGILAIVTAAEHATGLQLAPELLHPSNFATPDTLARTLASGRGITT